MTSSLSTGRGMTTFENLYVSSRVPTSFKRIEKIVLVFFYNIITDGSTLELVIIDEILEKCASTLHAEACSALISQ